MKTLVSVHGYEIVGTRDLMEATGHISSEIEDSAIGENRIEFDESGECDVLWETQKSKTDEHGGHFFVDDKGNIVRELDLHYTDEEAGITEPTRLFPESAKSEAPTRMEVPAKLDLGQLHDLQGIVHRGMAGLEKIAFPDGEPTHSDNDMAEAKQVLTVGDMFLDAIQEAMDKLR